MTRARRRWLACGVVAAMWLGLPGKLHAQPGQPWMTPAVQANDQLAPEFSDFTLPGPGQRGFLGPVTPYGSIAAATFSTQSQLRLSFAVDPGGAFGYLRLHVVATAAAATSTPRVVTLRFTAGSWMQRDAVVIEEAFEIPAGATTASFEMLLPKFCEWDLCQLQTRVGREVDDDLSFANAGVNANRGQAALAVVVPAGGRLPTSVQSELMQMGVQGGQVQHRDLNLADPTGWPREWLHLSSYDLVTMNAGELGQLQQNKATAAALRRWIRAGGNLWIRDCGDQWEQIAKITAALEIEPSADDPDGDPGASSVGADVEYRKEAAAAPPGWRFVDRCRESDSPVDAHLKLLGQIPREDAATTPAPNAAAAAVVPGTPPPTPVLPPSRTVVARRFGLGVVVAFAQGYTVPSEDVKIGGLNYQTPNFALAGSPLLNRLDWKRRHGINPGEPSAEFNNWLVPGVGMAPVTPFQVLITLFVVIVGPVNFWILARRKSLPLMLATAPALALATIALLLGYGVLTEGVGARVRARAYTDLDQRRGEAASWARLSYYSGLAPGAGMAFPRDTAVYPIEPRWGMDRNRRGSGARRTVRWGERQSLAAGWLASRTPTQLLALNARATDRRLDVREGDRGVRLVNELGSDMLHLALQDRQGRFYWTENVAAGATVEVVPVDRAQVVSKLRSVVADNDSLFPAGSEPRWGREANLPQLSTSLLDLHLAGLKSPLMREIGPGSYIAVTARGVNVDLGFPADAVSDEASFYVTRGTW